MAGLATGRQWQLALVLLFFVAIGLLEESSSLRKTAIWSSLSTATNSTSASTTAINVDNRTQPSIHTQRYYDSIASAAAVDAKNTTIGAARTESNLTLALCHPTLFGDPHMEAVLNFVAYYRCLGVDHFFFWYLPKIRHLDFFQDLQDLPYVTLTLHQVPPRVKYFDQKKIQALCLSEPTYAARYDWALAVDADEYLWFAQAQTAKQFLQQFADWDFLSLGKWEYPTRFVTANNSDAPEEQASPNYLFGLSQYAFTTESFCIEDPRPQDGSGCPNWQGRAKFLARPDKLKASVASAVHGTGAFKKQPRSLFIPAPQAHFKEFYGILVTPDKKEKRPPRSFQVRSDEYDRVGLPQLNTAFDKDEKGYITLAYDTMLSDWLRFVANQTHPSSEVFNVSFSTRSPVETTGSLLPTPTPQTTPAIVAGGLSHYKTARFSGWNNQRQSAMMAWIIAYLTGHTLEFKPYQPSVTGVETDKISNYTHGDFWDMTHLRKYVHVKNISLENNGGGYEYGFFHSSRFLTRENVTDLGKYKTITYASTWSFLQHQMPWIDPWKSTDPLFERMMESFTYTQTIGNLATRVMQEIGEPFIALHIRKDRLPALDCQELGRDVLSGQNRGGSKYRQGGCHGVDWGYVLEKLYPNNTLLFYVAHDGSFRLDDAILPNSSVRVKQASDMKCLQDEEVPLAVVSAVEQVVATGGEFFVGSTHSSWTEYVIYKRALTKKDGKKNYDVWVKNLAFFDEKDGHQS